MAGGQMSLASEIQKVFEARGIHLSPKAIRRLLLQANLEARNVQIYELRKTMSVREIAERMGISPVRVWQIIREHVMQKRTHVL
jgi:DNA-directed RNA polymerase specialized sigma subunit